MLEEDESYEEEGPPKGSKGDTSRCRRGRRQGPSVKAAAKRSLSSALKAADGSRAMAAVLAADARRLARELSTGLWDQPSGLPLLEPRHGAAASRLKVFFEFPWHTRNDCKLIYATMINCIGPFFGYDFCVTNASDHHSCAHRKRIGYTNLRGHVEEEGKPRRLEAQLGLGFGLGLDLG